MFRNTEHVSNKSGIFTATHIFDVSRFSRQCPEKLNICSRNRSLPLLLMFRKTQQCSENLNTVRRTRTFGGPARARARNSRPPLSTAERRLLALHLERSGRCGATAEATRPKGIRRQSCSHSTTDTSSCCRLRRKVAAATGTSPRSWTLGGGWRP